MLFPLHIGFVSTRFAGTDGVSLESAKWAQILWDSQYVSYWYAGKLDRDPQASMEVPEASFEHPENAAINERVFGHLRRSPEITRKILNFADLLKRTLYDFVERFAVDILVIENALCIPMHIPLGIALTHYLAETGLPAIAHHHDFYWERDRFSVNAVGDYLQMAFPPALPMIQHVTINTFGQQELAHRKGCPSELIPNVLDFESGPPPTDDYAADLRQEIGLLPDDILVLQPTRVIPRKGIESAINLVDQLRDSRLKLVVTHESGDEGLDYRRALVHLAKTGGVDLRFIDARVGHRRGTDAQGRKIYSLADDYATRLPPRRKRRWDERDVVLIAYADQVRRAGQSPMAALRQFLLDNRLQELVSILHVLPFFPSSSDDGFAVADYRQVDPALGSWQDLVELGKFFDLMVDLVLNHCSAEHRWFREFLAGCTPYAGYFIEVDPASDVSRVARPRSTPLLTPFPSDRGARHVWTTFSADQVDLDWANPDVLVEMLDILLFYLQQGARIIRLDAVAYLGKQLGTPCIHLAQTHAAVKLLRAIVDALAPGTLLLTETNVPQRENVSYSGDGDEAHLVYQFSLPPLLLEAFLTGDARALMGWMSALEPPPPGTAYVNFTASHDGIGLRPLEGLLPAERIARLARAAQARGALVSPRRTPEGFDSPYELNVSFFSALGEPAGLTAEAHARRFLASQAVMLALRGIPAIYFPSLIGAPNDLEAVRRTGRARSINRPKFTRDELDTLLASRNSPASLVLEGYRAMLAARRRQAAFHPDAALATIDLGSEGVISWTRTSADRRQQILVLVNVAGTPASVLLPQRFERPRVTELLSMGIQWQSDDQLLLLPAGVAWLGTLSGSGSD